jgi:peptidoglycan/xylan/chitin deacetylase (PgdA/CDA1 family)
MSALCATAAFPNPLMAAQVPLPKPETRLPRGMVTFTFDDGIASNYEYALPILRSRGQAATAGIVATRVTSGNNDYMNVDQVRELEKAGWEIASHSLTHTRPIHIPKTYEQEIITGWHEDERTPGHYQAQYEYERIAGLYQDGKLLDEVESLANLEARKGVFWLDRAIAEIHVRPERTGSPENLAIRAGSYQRELEESKRILTGLGFAVDTYIAPHNYWTDDVEAMSRAYYSRACTGRDSDNRPASFDPFAIKRFMVHTKDTPQSFARIIRDHCLERGGWVVFCFHGTGANTGWEPYSAEGLDWLSAFIAQEKVPMVTVREGAAVMQDLKKKLPASGGKNIAKKGS